MYYHFGDVLYDMLVSKRQSVIHRCLKFIFVKRFLNCSLYLIFEIVFHISAAQREEIEFSSHRVPSVLTFLVSIRLFLVFLVALYRREKEEKNPNLLTIYEELH